jgi:putative transposase
MRFNPRKHHRRSICLKGYDYTQPGGYFITINFQDKECLLGKVTNDKIHLNDAGEMIKRWWEKISIEFINIKLDEYIIMPNHIHGIIFIVGADPRVCPYDKMNNHVRIKGEHTGSPLQISLSRLIQWFKTMTTNEYIQNVKRNDWQPFNKKLWQRNFYEHIIRNENGLKAIRQYIINNPQKWHLDRQNPDKK